MSSEHPLNPHPLHDTHRTIVPSDVRRFVELRQNVLGKDLSEFNTHLVYNQVERSRRSSETVSDVPKELIPQITPWVKILCSYRAINAPSVLGVKSGNIMLLLGRFPSNTLLFTSASLALLPSSLRTCSSVLPNANASGCAKKLESRMRWCFEWAMGLWELAGAMKSAGINFVPWWTSW